MRETRSTTVEELIAQENLTSRQLQALTGRSQPWVSARLQELGDRVVRLRSGRSVRYALARPAFGSDDRIPVWTVDSCGSNTWTLDVRPISSGRFALETASGTSRLWLGDRADGYYEGLPWFLSDLRPQGFIGRAIAMSLTKRGAFFPADPRDWNTSHTAYYLLANGDDLPGNLQVGHQAGLRVRRPPIGRRSSEYPDLAEAALQGESPGSSAGGEQPKFAVYSAERSAHVIVKFSPNGNDGIVDRWRDVLVTEHEAARVLRSISGIPAGEARLFSSAGRLFLESDRFDRKGEHGRLSMHSLQAVDAEFVGDGADWNRVMKGLLDRGLVSHEHTMDVRLLQAFGRCIGNTDMHLGNLSLAIDGDFFRLSPVYDMCSMCLAPGQSALLPVEQLPAWRDSEPSTMDADFPPDMKDALLALCREFWNGVAKHEHASREFATFAVKRVRSI